jgi:DUF177 domain-containing protein
LIFLVLDSMVIRVADIPDQGLLVESVDGFGALYPEEGWRLDTVRLLVERQGDEVVVTGGFEATARLACGRCLESLTASVEPTVDLHLLPPPRVRQGEVELLSDDLETDFYLGGTLDLGGLLRSETDLALPMKPLCRPDCRGLCPVCGANRNLTACGCASRGVDPRLAPLEALRRRFTQS